MSTTTREPPQGADKGSKQEVERCSARRVVSVWLNRFATDRLRRLRIQAARQNAVAPPADNPLVTVGAERGSWTIAAVNDAAAAVNLRPGLALADARALVPGLESREVDPIAECRALDALADSCGRFTPWVASEGDVSGMCAGLWLDISGCGHLFGGEDALLEDLQAHLDRLGFAHRMAVADTPGAAWAVARFGGERRAHVKPDDQLKALAPLPVAGLRLAPATVEGLNRMGLRTIGELCGVARAPLAVRFGTGVLDRLDQALGRRPETITPHRPVPVCRARLSFAEPIAHRNGIDAVLDKLLETLCAQLAEAHEGARSVLLTGFRTDGTVAELRVGTGRPVSDPAHLARLFREKLDGFDPEYGIEVAILAAEKTDRLDPDQAPLDASDGQTDPNLDYLLDRLGNRLGPSRVLRLQRQARHLPEYAAKSVPAAEASATVDGALDGGPLASRPLRLLPTPEPIQVMAPVPDHPPVLFRWRQRPYRVARADGPERIAPEWWREDPSQLFTGEMEARDYYRLEDETGARFWIFRGGLYRPEKVVHWYMHGFFA